MRVFAYLRISTAAQNDGDGFPRQEAACRAFAEAKGWKVLRVFKEQQTGSDDFTDRVQMAEAIELCGSVTGVEAIIVERVDRIARDLIVSEVFFRKCRERNIKVYAADSGEELVNASADPTRTLIRQIMGALAQWEKTMIVRKLTAGRAKKAAEQGRPCGGPVCYGWEPEERRAVDYIVRRHVHGRSIRMIARDLRRITRKHPSRFALPKATAKRHRPWSWGESFIHKVIKNWGPDGRYTELDSNPQ